MSCCYSSKSEQEVLLAAQKDEEKSKANIEAQVVIQEEVSRSRGGKRGEANGSGHRGKTNHTLGRRKNERRGRYISTCRSHPAVLTCSVRSETSREPDQKLVHRPEQK